jgi:hypothetical protein
MYRLALIALVALTAVALSSAADAFQCPKLVKQINEATAQRFDAAASGAKQTAIEVQALHDAGKHAEAEQKAKDALTTLGVKS